MGVELGLPFLGSLIVIWLLRRLDKSNINLKKFKGILERGEKQLSDVVLHKTEELKDATTEFEILQINTKKQLTNFRDEVGKAENTVTEIEARRAHFGEMGKDLSELESTTQSVKGQLSYISDFLDKIDHHYKRVQKLEERIAQADSKTSTILKLFQHSIDEKSTEHLISVESKVQDILNKVDYYEGEVKEEMDARQAKLAKNIQYKYTLLENSLRKSGQELSSDIESKFNHNLSLCTSIEERIGVIENQITTSIPRMLQELKDNADFHSVDNQARINKLLTIIQVTEENFQKNIQTFRDNIEEQKQEVSQAFLGEVDNLRDQVRQLDFETISKKDEIVQITRKEASKIAGQIEEFKEFHFKAKDEYAYKINHEKNKIENSLTKIYADYKDKYQNIVAESIQLEKNEAREIERFIKIGKEETTEINRLTSEFKILHNSLKSDYLEQTQLAQNNLKEEMSNIDEYVNNFNKAYENSTKTYRLLIEETEKGFANNYQAISGDCKKLHFDLEEKLKQLHADLKEDYLEQTESAQNNLKEKMSNIDEFINDFNKAYENSTKTYRLLIEETEKGFANNYQAISGDCKKLHFDLEEKLKQLHADLKEDYLEQTESAQNNLKEEMLHIDEFINDFNKAHENSTITYRLLIEKTEKDFTNNYQIISGDCKKLYVNLEEKLKQLHADLKEDYLEQTQSAQNTLKEEMSNIDEFINDFNKAYENSTKTYRLLIEETEKGFANNYHTISGDCKKLYVDLEEKLKQLHAHLKEDYLEQTQSAQNNLKEEMLNIDEFINDFNKAHENSTKTYRLLIEETEKGFANNYQAISGDCKKLHFDLEEKLKKLHTHLKEDYLEKTRLAQKKLDTMLEKLFNDYNEQLFREIEHVEGKHANTFEKFATISEKIEQMFAKNEQELLDTYHANHESHLDGLKKEFGSYQIDFMNTFEKLESKLESLSLEAKESVHKGEIHLEKQRVEIIEGSREILSKFVEKETEEFHENIQTNLKKIQIEAKDIVNLKIDLQSKQADLMESLKDQKKKLESELKTTTYEQLELFEKKGKKKVDTLSDEINEMTSQNLDKMMATLKVANSEMHTLQESHIKNVQQEHNKVHNITINVNNLNNQIVSLQNALEKFKSESEIVKVIQNKTNELKEMINHLGIESEKIEEKQDQVTHLFTQVDEFKMIQVQFDTEISMLSDKKARISKVEEKLDFLIHTKNEIDERNRDLIDTKQLLDEILDKQRQVEIEKQKADTTIEDLLNQQNLITSAIESINTQDHNIHELTQHISKIDLLLKKLDTKAENLRAHMENLNTQMMSIEKNDAEIEVVKEKFLQIEDLLEDIENRKIQIEVMRKRYEDLKESVNSSVEQIVQVENNAEEKVRKLAEFVNAVGTDISSGGAMDLSKIQTSKKDVIIRLSQMGWGRDEIAAKIDVDMSTVETILSTNPH